MYSAAFVGIFSEILQTFGQRRVVVATFAVSGVT
jgi:hypothetical protein